MPASNETTIALAEQRISALEDKVAKLSADRDQALKWGIMTLGAAVMGLVGWIAGYLQNHIK
jgi:hypothetical protein